MSHKRQISQPEADSGGDERAKSASKRKRDTRGWFKTLISFASRCKGRMLLAEVLSIGSVFSGLVPFYAIYRIIDAAVYAGDAASLSWDTILFWCGIAVAFYLLQQVLFAASTVNSHISAYTILANLREGIASKLMNASLGTARAKSIGNLKNLVIDRIEQIEIPLAHFIPELSANLLLAVAIVIWFVVIDWRLALACIVTVPIGLLVLALGMQGYYKMYDGYMDEQDHVNSVVVEYIEGIHVVKAFNQATSSYAKFSDAVTGFLGYTLNWMKTSWFASAMAMSILPTTLLGVVPVGVALYLGGELDPATFGLACVLAIAVVTPVTYLGKAFNDVNLVAYCITDARAFLELPELSQPKEPAEVSDYGIEMTDARFSYTNGVEVLHGVNLSAPAGSFTALVGPSGSGKSTIARMIVRHWDLDSGSIRIGGADVRDMPLSQLSSLVSVVSQDDFLLDGTLRDNVAMGRPGASDEEIEAAARAASCEEFIARLPKGWDTPAGEAGHALSGGERQRICIARAILKNAPIVVFDEATAFADPENEARIQRSVARLSEGKTLIVIAHRLSTITAADCICVVEDGDIVARGTHDELLAQNDLYASMWKAHIGAADWAAGSHGEEAGSPEGGDAR